MRYLTYSLSGQARLGVLHADHIVDLPMFLGGPDTMLEFIAAGRKHWQETADQFVNLDIEKLVANGQARPFEEKLLLAPIPRPTKNVLCLGRNYFKHFLEGAVARGEDEKPPPAPIYFTKPPTAINTPYGDIELDPQVTTQLDWEAELGVVIGIGGRRIKNENALEHVFGYTVINDITARDLQSRHVQFFKGKGLDGSCPIGPIIVTPDELPSPVHLPIRCRVNGVTKQDSNTSQMMYDVAAQIADISMAMTLEPGDIISTGTPEGVGAYSKPPEFLAVGDVVETEVEGIGILRNKIVGYAIQNR